MAQKERDTGASAEERVDDIKVTDRRLFGRDGQLRQELADETEVEEEEGKAEQAAETTSSSTEEGAAAGGGFEHRPVDSPPGVDFTMLVSGMAQSALIYLGEIANPGTGKAEVNPEQARIQIDLLDVLRTKCRGNLTPEEEGLLDRMLYQLRMLYVSRSGQTGT